MYAKRRKMDNMEYNAATYLAIKGYQVKMTPEGSGKYALAIVNGKSRYGDGFISLTSYEQRSSTPINDATARKTVENAIIMQGRKAQILPYYLIITELLNSPTSLTEQNIMKMATGMPSIVLLKH